MGHVHGLLRFTAILFAGYILTACGAGGEQADFSGTTDSSISNLQNRPSVLRLARAVSANDSGELLVNPDFTAGLDGWVNCSNDTPSFVEDGAVLLSAQDCVHQSVEVVAGQQFDFACEVRRLDASDEWTGLALSFYDENWRFISETDAASIVDTNYQSYQVAGTAPDQARYAGAWVYTESGASITGCSLINTNAVEPPPEPPPQPPTEPPPEPPTEPPAAGELLVNADFSDELNSWDVCDNGSEVTFNNSGGTTVALLNGRNCIHQGVEVTSNQQLTFTCQVGRVDGGSDWSGVGLSFYDANWGFVSEPDPQFISSTNYQQYQVTGVAPARARYVGAWVYTNSGVAVAGCSLVMSGETEPPPTEPPPTEPPVSNAGFCPAYSQSPLYRERANTLVLTPDMDDWEQRIARAPADTQILLSDGEYYLDSETIVLTQPDVTIRSLSGNRDGVAIEGIGFYSGTSEGFQVAADRITITEMTMYGMRRHAIAMKPELDVDGTLDDVYVYNMDISDTGTQHVKASDGGENRNAVVACSTIGYSPGVAVGDYIGAIGIFRGVDVSVRDNYIYNITGDGTGCNVAEPNGACIYESSPAIYLRESRDSIVERNTIVESFRGISLGLTNGNLRGIIRNNFIYRTSPGDMGISVELSQDTIVEHNTVLVEGYWAPIEVKEGTGGHIFRNNLTNLPIQLRGTTGTFLEGNIEYATPDYFIAPGDVHLRTDSVAIGAGVTPSATTSDIDGDIRSDRWDVGADQFRN